MGLLDLKKATSDTSLILYGEQSPAEIRSAQRLVKAGQLARIVPGMVSSSPVEDWPALIARERLRVLAALFPGSVLGYRSAFNGGLPEDGVIHLIGGYRRSITLPGLTVMLWKGPAAALGDAPMLGRALYYRGRS